MCEFCGRAFARSDKLYSHRKVCYIRIDLDFAFWDLSFYFCVQRVLSILILFRHTNEDEFRSRVSSVVDYLFGIFISISMHSFFLLWNDSSSWNESTVTVPMSLLFKIWHLSEFLIHLFWNWFLSPFWNVCSQARTRPLPSALAWKIFKNLRVPWILGGININYVTFAYEHLFWVIWSSHRKFFLQWCKTPAR